MPPSLLLSPFLPPSLITCSVPHGLLLGSGKMLNLAQPHLQVSGLNSLGQAGLLTQGAVSRCQAQDFQQTLCSGDKG